MDSNISRIMHHRCALVSALRNPPVFHPLKDGRPFVWTNVRTVVLKATRERVRRYVLRVEDRHVGILLLMGGEISKGDVGRTLVVDVQPDGQKVDAFVQPSFSESSKVKNDEVTS